MRYAPAVAACAVSALLVSPLACSYDWTIDAADTASSADGGDASRADAATDAPADQVVACASDGGACQARAGCCEGLQCGFEGTCVPQCRAANGGCNDDKDCCFGLRCRPGLIPFTKTCQAAR